MGKPLGRSLVSVHAGAKQRMIQFMGPNKIIMGGLALLAPEKLCPWQTQVTQPAACWVQSLLTYLNPTMFLRYFVSNLPLNVGYLFIGMIQLQLETKVLSVPITKAKTLVVSSVNIRQRI